MASEESKLEVHVGIISHKNGDNVYAGKTGAALDAQLAEYCREWWHETELEDEAPEDDRECIDAYFEAMLGVESYHTAIVPVLE